MVVFGGSSGRGHALNATLKLQSVLEQRLKRIQMGLFRRELSRTDIAALSPAEKLAYFSAVDNLMEENASERKKLSKEIKKKPLGVLEQEASLESILGVAVSLVDEGECCSVCAQNDYQHFTFHLVFTGSPKVKKDRIKACISAEQVWKKWEADVQIKTWGETLSDEELKTWLKPDQNLPSNSKSVGQEKERRRLRDTYFQGMQDKKAKWI